MINSIHVAHEYHPFAVESIPYTLSLTGVHRRGESISTCNYLRVIVEDHPTFFSQPNPHNPIVVPGNCISYAAFRLCVRYIQSRESRPDVLKIHLPSRIADLGIPELESLDHFAIRDAIAGATFLECPGLVRRLEFADQFLFGEGNPPARSPILITILYKDEAFTLPWTTVIGEMSDYLRTMVETFPDLLDNPDCPIVVSPSLVSRSGFLQVHRYLSAHAEEDMEFLPQTLEETSTDILEQFAHSPLDSDIFGADWLSHPQDDLEAHRRLLPLLRESLHAANYFGCQGLIHKLCAIAGWMAAGSPEFVSDLMK